MELNYDCFRDVLLTLESVLEIRSGGAGRFGDPNALSFSRADLDMLLKLPRLSKYDRGQLFYALHNLNQAGYITANIDITDGIIMHCIVGDITFNGHMFLKTIRDDNIWKKTMSLLSTVGSASLPIIVKIASNLICTQLGI